MAGGRHVVHTPDLYDGATFESLDKGVAYAESVGFDEIVARGAAAAKALPSQIVYAGFSLGALPAQFLAPDSARHPGRPAARWGADGGVRQRLAGRCAGAAARDGW